METIDTNALLNGNNTPNSSVKITEDQLGQIAAPLSDKVLLIGVGECGCKNAYEMVTRGYTGYFINTAAPDLDAIPVERSYKYYIPNAAGCNKDRDLGKDYAVKYYQQIAETILNKFKSFTHYVFCYSMGGGSGSSIGLMVMQAILALTAHLPKSERPIVIPWQVAASPTEKGQSVKKNVLDCYNEFTQVPVNGMTYFVTNKNYDTTQKDVVNKKAADALCHLFSLAISNNISNIDQYEILQYMAITGNMMPIRLVEKEGPTPTGSIELKMTYDDIFSKPVSGNSNLHLIYSLKSPEYLNAAEAVAEATFGVPQNQLTGFNGKDNYVFAFGLPYPSDEIMTIAKVWADTEKHIKARSNGNGLQKINLSPDVEALTPKTEAPSVDAMPVSRDPKVLFGNLLNR